MKKLFLLFCTLFLLGAAARANNNFAAGVASFTEEKYPLAIVSFSKALSAPDFLLPEYAEFFLAKSYYQSFAFSSAEAMSNLVIQSKNEILVPDAYILIGKCRLDTNRNKEAADAFGYLIKKHPDNRLISLAYYLLAEANLRQGKNKEAYNLYSYVDNYYPLSPYSAKAKQKAKEIGKKYKLKPAKLSAKKLYEKGKAFWDAGDYKAAAAWFNRLAKEYPHAKQVKSALYMTGLAEFETADFEAAINTLEKNIREKGPGWQNSYYYLGRSYGRRGKYDKAINALQYFLSLYPKSPLADNAYYYTGYYYEIEEDFVLAINAYQNLLKNHPKSAIADSTAYQIGRIYYRQGNKEFARRAFAQAFNYPLGYDSAKCFYWWGKLTEEKSRDEAASIYAYIINNLDYTYYSYRGDDRLKALGYRSPLNHSALRKNSLVAGENLPPRINLLIEAGLNDYARYEMGEKNENGYQIRLGMLLNRRGEYYLPISFTEKKVKGAILKGEATGLPKNVWELAYPKGFWPSVKKEASAFGVDPYLVLALIREESRFNPKAVSSSRARGLMQIIAPTARKICEQLDLSYRQSALYNPPTNIKMGTYYFASLMSRFEGNPSLALAGYNGGPSRVKKWVGEWYNGQMAGIDIDDFVINIPIRETRDYVEKVMGSYYQYKRIYD